MSHRHLWIAAISTLVFGSTAVLAEPYTLSVQSARSQQLAQNLGFDKGQVLEQLNLTPEQRQQIQQIRQKYQGQIDQKQETLQASQQELVQLMTGTASASDIRSQYQEVVQLRQEISNLRFEGLLETREVLTPGQRSQFAQLMQQRLVQFRERWSERGER